MSRISIRYLKASCIKLIICLYALLSGINSIAVAQEIRWPVVHYGGRGVSYETAPKMSGYIMLNTRYLKGLMHRTYMAEARFDTLVNSDTLRGRINLFILGGFVDIELSNQNVVSVPHYYITSIVGSSLPKIIKSLTRWVIISPRAYNPFGRLLAQKGNMTIYDNSQWDSSYRKYECPMFFRNGHEEIKINSMFGSARKTLIKFIKKRYAVDFSKNRLIDERALIQYVLIRESEMENEKNELN